MNWVVLLAALLGMGETPIQDPIPMPVTGVCPEGFKKYVGDDYWTSCIDERISCADWNGRDRACDKPGYETKD